MEHKGVEVSFVDKAYSPQVFKSANWWSIDKRWVRVIERVEFKVVTREKTRKGIVETEWTEIKDDTVAMFAVDEVLSVKHPDA